ncbi:hypothetical protein CLOM_g22843 [Closterium sp. NIES-68]|nr:hypothetical protein CLOM_g22843 [Closterium sp. NIES-68]
MASAGTASEMASELDSVSNGFSFITLTSDAGDSARTAWMSPAANLAGAAGSGALQRECADPLAWYDRVRILSEVSGALLYLHQHSPPIVHRDLKPDNVLLDGNRMSKLGDVGLARLIAEDDYNVTARVQGTVGYIDPEEVATCEISVLSDVYAFGLIVLQLLMGEPQVKLVHRLLADTAVKLAADQSRRGRAGGNTEAHDGPCGGS